MAVAGVAIGAWTLILQDEDRDSAATAGAAGSATGSPTEAGETVAPQPAAPAAPEPPAAPKAAARKRQPAPTPAPGGPATSRLFVWLPVRGASHYRVEFFRDGRKIYDARPAEARLELPGRWTYRGRRFRVTAGRYRWSVRPGFGARSRARYAPAIVRSAWVVPK